MNDLGWRRWIETRRIEIGVIIVGILFLGIGLWWWRQEDGYESGIVILRNSESKVLATDSARIVVDVAGAVVNPGVYKLEYGVRVDEVIKAAGGFSDKADIEWVEKYLNRSEKITDGRKVYIPKIEEKERVGTEIQARVDVKSNEGVNINAGSQAELEELPGIGPVTAKKIISGRPYSRTEELVEKKIVSGKVWEQIKGMVAVY